MNPILPLEYFIPDPEAHQFKDGRIYLYGSMDINGNNEYCSHNYRVYSSDDLINWTDHGESFNTLHEEMGKDFYKQALYAPDCIEKDGKYYLYFCTANNGEGVAISDNPGGHFKFHCHVEGANLDAIDPAIFIDDDGQAYLYWGQCNARGAKLKPNMTEIDETTLNTNLINEEEHGFHEGSSMRKRNGIYYLLYADISRGRPTCLSYAMSKSPLGPFVKGGIIIDNTGCDPETWNNHGCIAQFNGNWYVFYHRSTQNSRYNRRVCVEPITFNDDGTINEVEMTTQGVSDPLDALRLLDASRACMLFGETYIDANDSEEYLKVLKSGDWAAYKYINFHSKIKHFQVTASGMYYPGEIELRIDRPNGRLIGRCDIMTTGGWNCWKTFTCPIESTEGIHVLYLVFKGSWGRPFNILNFKFS